MCLSVLLMCMYVYHACDWCLRRLNFQELELPMVVSHVNLNLSPLEE